MSKAFEIATKILDKMQEVMKLMDQLDKIETDESIEFQIVLEDELSSWSDTNQIFNEIQDIHKGIEKQTKEDEEWLALQREEKREFIRAHQKDMKNL